MIEYRHVRNAKITCSKCGHEYTFPNLPCDENGNALDDRGIEWWFKDYGWDVENDLCPLCHMKEKGRFYTVGEANVSSKDVPRAAPNYVDSGNVFWSAEEAEDYIERRYKQLFTKNREKKEPGFKWMWTVWEHHALYSKEAKYE